VKIIYESVIVNRNCTRR